MHLLVECSVSFKKGAMAIQLTLISTSNGSCLSKFTYVLKEANTAALKFADSNFEWKKLKMVWKYQKKGDFNLMILYE